MCQCVGFDWHVLVQQFWREQRWHVQEHALHPHVELAVGPIDGVVARWRLERDGGPLDGGALQLVRLCGDAQHSAAVETAQERTWHSGERVFGEFQKRTVPSSIGIGREVPPNGCLRYAPHGARVVTHHVPVVEYDSLKVPWLRATEGGGGGEDVHPAGVFVCTVPESEGNGKAPCHSHPVVEIINGGHDDEGVHGVVPHGLQHHPGLPQPNCSGENATAESATTSSVDANVWVEDQRSVFHDKGQSEWRVFHGEHALDGNVLPGGESAGTAVTAPLDGNAWFFNAEPLHDGCHKEQHLTLGDGHMFVCEEFDVIEMELASNVGGGSVAVFEPECSEKQLVVSGDGEELPDAHLVAIE